MTTPTQPWTKEQIRYEWEYRVDEYLGQLCGDGTPTPEQNQMALEEADRAVGEILRLNQVNDE